MCASSRCAPSPIQTHSSSVSLALPPMKEPSHTCTHRVRLRHNQAQVHTLALDASNNACMRLRLSLASQACPIFKTLEAHLHTFSHAWTHPPLPMWERPVLEDTLRCCKAGRISQVKYLNIRHLLCQVLSWKLLADTTPVVNGPAPADYCVLGAPMVICTAHTCPTADPVCHTGLQHCRVLQERRSRHSLSVMIVSEVPR